MNDIMKLVEKTNSRPTIRIVAGQLAETTRKAERSIVGRSIYQRGAVLVLPVVEDVSATDGRTTKIAQLTQLGAPYLRLVLSDAARWERFNIRKNDWAETDPPANIATGI